MCRPSGRRQSCSAAALKLDAVSLCMPPEPRFAIARDALDAGLHVLMEKPPTPTVGELDAITAHAAEGRAHPLHHLALAIQ